MQFSPPLFWLVIFFIFIFFTSNNLFVSEKAHQAKNGRVKKIISHKLSLF